MIGTEGETVLRLTRRFEAPRERVFDAWTNPDVLRRWWAAQPDWEGAEAEVDLRPGGRYRLSMRDTGSGATHTVAGEYTEVRRPERLAYTWSWEGEPTEMSGSERTLVVVEFLEDGGATEVVLTHSGFANGQIREMHAHGWQGCLDNLGRRVFGRTADQRGLPGAPAQAALDGAQAGERLRRPATQAPWHFLYFLPEPHQHGSLRPILSRSDSVRCTVTGSAPGGSALPLPSIPSPPASAAAPIACAPASDWCS